MIQKIINDEFLDELFPPERADEFFNALYGGAETGAFDISLRYNDFNKQQGILYLHFLLTERPGKCMACSLTAGLPPVFQRHPVINLKGMIRKIEEKLSPEWSVKDWSIGSTTVLGPETNAIPLMLYLEKTNG